MNFFYSGDGKAFNIDQIQAVNIKQNQNDGSFKHNREYPFVADVHVSGREKPFTVYLTGEKEAELSRLVQNGENSK